MAIRRPRPGPEAPRDIFQAARAGDAVRVRACLGQGADPSARNGYGFTALHCAAMGANAGPEDGILTVIGELLSAGAVVDAVSTDGRTALFLAAEFSPTVAPVQALLRAGATADVRDRHGNHIVANAMNPEVQALLAGLTGHPVPEPPSPHQEPVQLGAAEWRAAKSRVEAVFARLSGCGLVALPGTGTTQEDGLADGLEEFRRRGGSAAGLVGICFYTRQDASRARRTAELAVAFWGAPAGAPADCQRVGGLVVQAFRDHGCTVDWDGSPGMRPIVQLRSAGG